MRDNRLISFKFAGAAILLAYSAVFAQYTQQDFGIAHNPKSAETCSGKNFAEIRKDTEIAFSDFLASYLLAYKSQLAANLQVKHQDSLNAVIEFDVKPLISDLEITFNIPLNDKRLSLDYSKDGTTIHVKEPFSANLLTVKSVSFVNGSSHNELEHGFNLASDQLKVWLRVPKSIASSGGTISIAISYDLQKLLTAQMEFDLQARRTMLEEVAREKEAQKDSIQFKKPAVEIATDKEMFYPNPNETFDGVLPQESDPQIVPLIDPPAQAVPETTYGNKYTPIDFSQTCMRQSNANVLKFKPHEQEQIVKSEENSSPVLAVAKIPKAAEIYAAQKFPTGYHLEDRAATQIIYLNDVFAKLREAIDAEDYPLAIMLKEKIRGTEDARTDLHLDLAGFALDFAMLDHPGLVAYEREHVSVPTSHDAAPSDVSAISSTSSDAPAVELDVLDGQCLGGGCSNFNSNYPTGTFSTTSSSWTTVSSCIYGGEYAYYSVTTGCTYEWTLCSADGASCTYDSQLSLWNQAGTTQYCYSDDFCGTQSKIMWTATFTGTVRVLVSQYSCANNTTCTTLLWRQAAGASVPCTSFSAPTSAWASQSCVDVNCSFTLNASGGAGGNYVWLRNSCSYCAAGNYIGAGSSFSRSESSAGTYTYYVMRSDYPGSGGTSYCSTPCLTVTVTVTTPSGTPSLSAPANGTVYTTVRRPTFSWSCSGCNLGCPNGRYQLYVGGSLYYNGTSTSYTPTWDMSPGVYTWYVRRIDDCGSTASSATWTVTIAPENYCGDVNHNSTNWTLSSGTTVSGRHYNVATFTLNSGITINVDPSCHYFNVEATNIYIYGTINATGAGYAGGAGGQNGLYAWTDHGGYGGSGGSAGSGTGGGGAGSGGATGGHKDQSCVPLFGDYGLNGGGGGAGGGRGGGYGGAGGWGLWGSYGGDVCKGGTCRYGGVYGSGASSGGASYGNATDFGISWGSGGGGAGGGGGGYNHGGNTWDYPTYTGAGGAGGGQVSLYATSYLYITGAVYANGTNGAQGGQGAQEQSGSYACDPADWDCCLGFYYCRKDASGGAGGGGGGGSGGGIFLRSNLNIYITGTLYARGGNGGADNLPRPSNGSCYDDYSGGGGGGGGGRIKIVSNPCDATTYTISPTASVTGGTGGSYYGYYGTRNGDPGANGTYVNNLRVPRAGTNGLWQGFKDTNWDNSCNWDTYQIPDAATDVTIPTSPSGGRWPTKTGDITIGSATCRTLNMQANSQLTLTGNWTAYNTFTRGTGTVFFTGSGASYVSRNASSCVGDQYFGSGTSTYNYCPVYAFYVYSRSMSLIRRDEIPGCGGGTISGIYVYVNNANSHNFRDLRVYFSEITSSEAPTSWTAVTEVYYTSSRVFSATGWVYFDITDYNWDVNNLLISWQHGNSDTWYTTNYPYFRYTTTAFYSQAYNYSDYSLPTSFGLTTSRVNYRLAFTGSGITPGAETFYNLTVNKTGSGKVYLQSNIGIQGTLNTSATGATGSVSGGISPNGFTINMEP